MQPKSNQVTFFFTLVIAITVLYLLAPILAPFIFSFLLAYLLNPLVLKLDKYRIPHIVSVLLLLTLTFSIFLLIILLIIPLVATQVTALLDAMPTVVAWLQDSLIPWLQEIIDFNSLKQSVSESLPKVGDVMGLVKSSSHTLIVFFTNVVLIPVVSFYLLRDWASICDACRNALPTSYKATILKLVDESDEVLSAFFRGQFLVMISVAIIYGIGLTLAGLNVGFIIGLLGGLLSIVPYLGSLFVLTMATLFALVQFGTLSSLLAVWSVYLVGQSMEGWVLTPYFVGNRIGLHPVVVIFAIMAGGTLFGFFGVLVALPAAALLKVLLGFYKKQYLQ